MSDYPRPVVRLMADVVSATSAKVLPVIQAAELAIYQQTHPEATQSNIIDINYQFGYLREVIQTMKQYENSPNYRYMKYPLIALFLDIPENYGNSGGYPGQCVLQMAICYPTDPDVKSEERYNYSIRPILLPIYYELIRQIECSPNFVTRGPRISHSMKECPYWSKSATDNGGNVFADFTDAIWIENLQLTINFPQFKTILT